MHSHIQATNPTAASNITFEAIPLFSRKFCIITLKTIIIINYCYCYYY